MLCNEWVLKIKNDRRNLNGLFLKIILINDIVCNFDKNYDCGKV